MRNTKLVGIINVTPDSFSDGGQNLDSDAAIAAVARMIEDGADVIDIGAESTRPGAAPVSPDEEWRRLEPVLRALTQFPDMRFSLDTRHSETVKRALDYNIAWINDVSGFSDPSMVAAVQRSNCKLVIMHSLTVPADKNVVLPPDTDVMALLMAWAQARFIKLQASGFLRERFIFDPGIGFSKTPRQSLAILQNVKRFAALGVPILIGHSRKSFLAAAGDSVEARDAATLEISRLLFGHVDYLRVHNVALHRKAFPRV